MAAGLMVSVADAQTARRAGLDGNALIEDHDDVYIYPQKAQSKYNQNRVKFDMDAAGNNSGTLFSVVMATQRGVLRSISLVMTLSVTEHIAKQYRPSMHFGQRNPAVQTSVCVSVLPAVLNHRATLSQATLTLTLLPVTVGTTRVHHTTSPSTSTMVWAKSRMLSRVPAWGLV